MEPELPEALPPASMSGTCALPPITPGPDCELLDRTLALARSFLKSGARRQAMDVYWQLISQHLYTVQGRAARRDLLQLAARFDDEGAQHAALEIYRRLLNTEACGSHER